MKFLISLISLALTLTGICSWPADTIKAGKIANNAEKVFAKHFKEGETYISTSDYRGVTITFDPKEKKYNCKVPVGYYEVSSWLSHAHDDKKKTGWSRRPSNGLQSKVKDLGSLVGVLDQASITFEKYSVVRTQRSTKSVVAVWNHIEFDVPIDKISVLYQFLGDLYGDYLFDTKVSIYIK